VRLDIRRTGTIKDGDQAIGNRVRVKVVKNKVAPPFRQAEFDIMFDEGISTTGDLLDLGVEAEVVGKSGAWFNYGEVRLGQGRENSKNFLKENPDLFAEIHQKVLIAKGITKVDEPEAGDAASDAAASGDVADEVPAEIDE